MSSVVKNHEKFASIYGIYDFPDERRELCFLDPRLRGNDDNAVIVSDYEKVCNRRTVVSAGVDRADVPSPRWGEGILHIARCRPAVGNLPFNISLHSFRCACQIAQFFSIIKKIVLAHECNGQRYFNFRARVQRPTCQKVSGILCRSCTQSKMIPLLAGCTRNRKTRYN